MFFYCAVYQRILLKTSSKCYKSLHYQMVDQSDISGNNVNIFKMHEDDTMDKS